jgi:CRISPR-associated protein Cmr5
MGGNEMPSIQQTEDQRRANRAWECINNVRHEPAASNYASLAQKMPSYILTNGLGQTLAYLRAKTSPGNEHDFLYRHVSGWVCEQLAPGKDKPRSLLEWLIQNDSNLYRRATTETLAFLAWLKRFAEAELK